MRGGLIIALGIAGAAVSLAGGLNDGWEASRVVSLVLGLVVAALGAREVRKRRGGGGS